MLVIVQMLSLFAMNSASFTSCFFLDDGHCVQWPCCSHDEAPSQSMPLLSFQRVSTYYLAIQLFENMWSAGTQRIYPMSKKTSIMPQAIACHLRGSSQFVLLNECFSLLLKIQTKINDDNKKVLLFIFLNTLMAMFCTIQWWAPGWLD